jgi:ubiquinone/menaquinone biosynthesis C-methylase UbiE
LPFKNNSIECISSLCVLEHIGLGRYGDKLDPFGTEKAIEEIKRVTKKGGFVIVSVPVYRENAVFFNAHRAFTRSYIIELFHSFDLLEEKYI